MLFNFSQNTLLWKGKPSQVLPISRKKNLMLHFFKLYFKFPRFMLKYKSLIEIIWHIVLLQNRHERIDIIIADFIDPMEGDPCY